MPVDRTRVTVDITSNQSPTAESSGTTSRNDPYSNAEEQLCEKPRGHELGQEPGEAV